MLDSEGNSGQSDGNEENGGRLNHGNEVEASVTHANPEEGGNLVKYEM